MKTFSALTESTVTTIVELISWQKFWPKIVPLSPYTPQCCVCVKRRAFFGNQINYYIEWGGKEGDKHCKLRFLPTFISTIASNFFRLSLFYGKLTSIFFSWFSLNNACYILKSTNTTPLMFQNTYKKDFLFRAIQIT